MYSLQLGTGHKKHAEVERTKEGEGSHRTARALHLQDGRADVQDLLVALELPHADLAGQLCGGRAVALQGEPAEQRLLRAAPHARERHLLRKNSVCTNPPANPSSQRQEATVPLAGTGAFSDANERPSSKTKLEKEALHLLLLGRGQNADLCLLATALCYRIPKRNVPSGTALPLEADAAQSVTEYFPCLCTSEFKNPTCPSSDVHPT